MPDAAASIRHYRSSGLRKMFVCVVLGILLLGCAIADFLVGSGQMPPGEALHILTHPGAVPAIDRQIVFDIRLPMTLTAVLVGIALSAAGAQMQTILGNPLAEPYTLGISAAASFGAALAAVTSFTSSGIGEALGMAGSAWVFAVAASVVMLIFAKLRGSGAESMILLGIAIVFLFDALLALMQYLASQAQLEQVVFWTLGSLSRSTWPQIAMLGILVAVCVAAFYRSAWSLTAFRMGDARAQALGVNVDRVRTLTLIAVSLIAATAVSMSGTIGFIGLVGPHIARTLVGEEQRYFLTSSMLAGGVLLTGASLVSKIIQPGVILPVGIITAVVGVPVFIAVVMSRRRRVWM